MDLVDIFAVGYGVMALLTGIVLLEVYTGNLPKWWREDQSADAKETRDVIEKIQSILEASGPARVLFTVLILAVAATWAISLPAMVASSWFGRKQE